MLITMALFLLGAMTTATQSENLKARSLPDTTLTMDGQYERRGEFRL